ncbi:23S rRNA (guanosine(2251)-2'-O)-methyltransferase RlmB [Synechococcus sp. BSF8S]|uniref:23S rRNA (guanosine(2251)-2'-O)-methyltransferase RlmB n=1 Tax=Synechococcales TaxID=1890424 RepID=UPI00162ADE18|nr:MULTISPECIES: 23S rRNA (guanosine(2251)-2'-O)-methyltransferase RlmB [unclassified Synechococcus]MBC1261002.1 23S rRNA (guanosine(2251)-2'-O)-methyltransferase RlmB [Synechococcus sp. BSF8S]MBC1263905.1 23S rRNA (guanosine(2251)-2'-O)-methyltransferase RlmB [Synechococcus sp. BSA11S]
MSQRFERRRPKGAGSGDRPSGGARGGKPSRFGGPRPEWRGSGGSGGDSERDSRDKREGRPPESRGGYRPDAPRRESFQRPQGDGRPSGRPTRVIGSRPSARRFDDQRPEGGRRPEGRPEGRDGGRRPSFGAPRFSRPDGERPRFQSGRPPARAPRFNEQESPGPEASGSSERFSAEPADDLIWGRHPAQAALESDRPIHRIWCTPELRFAPRFLQLLRDAKASGVLVEEVTWARLGQISSGAVHQGIVLQAAAAETLDLPSLIEGCRGLGEAPLLMAVDGLTDPHNLGAIVRSAEALGAHGLVLPQRRNAGLTGSVAKVAAGALEHLPVARVVNLNRSIEQLKDAGYRVVGLAEEGNVSLMEADLDGPLVVVTGSEAQGLSMLTRKHCDQLIRIPLRGATPSLNASVATALLLYEIARRGWMKTISGNAPAPRLVRPQVPTTAAPASSPHHSAPETAEEIQPVVQELSEDPQPALNQADSETDDQDSQTDQADQADQADGQDTIQQESTEHPQAETAPELDLQVALPAEIELSFAHSSTSPFQGDIRL